MRLNIPQFLQSETCFPDTAWEGDGQSGFTIVELLVATAVFGTVMILLTFGIIQISDVYYKGVTISSTQNAARNIMADISQSIEYSGGQVGTTLTTNAVAGKTYGFCIGSEAYYYQLGYEVENSPTTGQAYHGLVIADNDLGACPIPIPPDPSNPNTPYDFANHSSGNSVPPGGQEMLGQNMRLSKLTITPGSIMGLYNIDVQVTYGADDLLNNATTVNGGLSGEVVTNCKGEVGQQFCATSELQATVEKRIN
jgi:prepilin-type N-terminal cleavage/methylation domain-containing protein